MSDGVEFPGIFVPGQRDQRADSVCEFYFGDRGRGISSSPLLHMPAPDLGEVVGEAEFLGDALGDHEGIQGRFAEALGDFIQNGGEAHPALQPGEEFAIGDAVLREHGGQGAGLTGEHDQGQGQELHLDAEAFAGLQAINDLQVMSPGLGPVFPGMGGGISTDEGLRPIRGRGALIIGAEAGGIVLPFIAEALAKGQAQGMIPGEIRQETLPEVVRAFMPEMSEQGAAALAEGLAVDLPVGVVRFLEIDGDDAIQVTGGHGGIRHGADDVKGQACLGIALPSGQGDAEPTQGVNEATFGHLHATPERAVAIQGEVRNRPVHPAGRAQGVGGSGGQNPVAHAMLGAIGTTFHPGIGPQPAELAALQIKTDVAVALQTMRAAKEKDVVTFTGESLHKKRKQLPDEAAMYIPNRICGVVIHGS